MDQSEILGKINDTISTLTEIRDFISQYTGVEEQAAPVVAVENTDELSTFESLKKVLMSDKWPLAVNPNLICDVNSESDKKERGYGVIELLVEKTLDQNSKFLDFGCAEGHCVAAAADLGCGFSVGFDIKSHNWTTSDKTKFTTNFDEVIALGPYDAILMYDVVDHVENETPDSIVLKAVSVLKPDGHIYARCHPWMSRHGTHLYHKLNKAYAHLVFTDEELAQIVEYNPEPNQKVLFPFATYDKLFKEIGGLRVLSRRPITEAVDPFFKIPKIAELIMKNTTHQKFPEFQMGLQFIDYVLSK